MTTRNNDKERKIQAVLKECLKNVHPSKEWKVTHEISGENRIWVIYGGDLREIHKDHPLYEARPRRDDFFFEKTYISFSINDDKVRIFEVLGPLTGTCYEYSFKKDDCGDYYLQFERICGKA